MVKYAKYYIQEIAIRIAVWVSCFAIYGGYLFCWVKDRNLFHRVDSIGNIFTSGAARSENFTDGVHETK